jgi:hypothetical protein
LRTGQELDILKIGLNLVIEKLETIADTQLVFEGKRPLSTRERLCDGKLRAAYFLAAEEVADGLDGRNLVVEVGIEVEVSFG